MTGSSRVIVVRHCLRSTPDVVDFYNGSNYTVHSPAWNTPPNWCTERGVEYMRQTGVYWQQQFRPSKNLFQRIRVLVDASQRDADTALALLQGLYENDTDWTVAVEYIPRLFDPFQYGLCPPYNVSEQDLEQAHNRLQQIPPPYDIDIVDALNVLSKLSDDPDLFVVENESNLTSLTLWNNSIQFVGPINAVKLKAQQLFYSRASGIDYLRDNITQAQMYDLLQWVQWSRRVLSIQSGASAHRGAVLADQVLSSLHHNDHTLTIIVGHDGDLDAMATALDVSWELPLYGTFATPPGTGLQFYREGGDIVQVSYLYNTYNLDNQTIAFDHADVMCDDVLCKLPLSELRYRLERTLRFYPGALDCYHAAQTNLPDDSFRYQSRLIVVAVVVGAIAAVLLCQRFLRRRRRKLNRNDPYDGVEITDLQLIS